MDRRAKFRKGLNALYLPRYDLLCSFLPDEWKPFRGFSTFAEQQALYDQGQKTGKIVTNAEAGESPHNYGCASDWVKFDSAGRPLWLNRKDPVWNEYREALKKVGGLRWGADWNNNGVFDRNDFDAPHNELKISCSWVDVWEAFREGGKEAADEQIRLHFLG